MSDLFSSLTPVVDLTNNKSDFFGTYSNPVVVDMDTESDEENGNRRKRAKQESAVVNWVFTIYPDAIGGWNLTRDVCKIITDLSVYAMFGKEKCPTTGREHLQCFCVLKKRMRRSALSSATHKSIHWEPMNGSLEDNEAYCSKDRDVMVHGTRPLTGGERERLRWTQARKALIETGDVNKVEDDQIFVQHYSAISAIANHNARRPDALDDVCGEWHFGIPKSGKSFAAFSHPTFYFKMPNKWWDGYRGEEVVVLDDVSPRHKEWLGDFLKIWCDRYAFRGEIKNGGGMFRPKKFIVTSNYSIYECFAGCEDIAAIRRRFSKVFYYPEVYNETRGVVRQDVSSDSDYAALVPATPATVPTVNLPTPATVVLSAQQSTPPNTQPPKPLELRRDTPHPAGCCIELVPLSPVPYQQEQTVEAITPNISASQRDPDGKRVTFSNSHIFH